MRGVGLLIGVLLSGCYQAHPPVLHDFEWEIARAQCEEILFSPGCGPARFTSDLDTCTWIALLQAGEERRRAVAEGHAVVDEEALSACLEGISCGLPPPACGRVTRGLGRRGEACESHASCAPDLRCLRFGGCGTCEPQAGVGDRCASYGDCSPPEREGEYGLCLPDADGVGHCRLHRVLSTELPEGASCAPIEVAPSRTEFPGCAAGLRCSSAEEGSRCVRPETAEGRPCLPTIGCDPGLLCGPRRLCVRGSLVTEVGAACNEFLDLGEYLPCDANRELSCVAGRCALRGVEPGAPCAPLSPGGECASGLICSWDRVCEVPRQRRDGAFCIYDAECVSGECSLTNRCVPPVRCRSGP